MIVTLVWLLFLYIVCSLYWVLCCLSLCSSVVISCVLVVLSGWFSVIALLLMFILFRSALVLVV